MSGSLSPSRWRPREFRWRARSRATRFDSETTIELTNAGGTETNKVHTSCSQPLRVGDVFGSLTLVAFNGESGGGSNLVTYTYELMNNGDPLSNITVMDSRLGNVSGPLFDLATGGKATFMAFDEISVTTMNEATAQGFLANGDECIAMDDAIVVVEDEPPPQGDHCDAGKPKSLVFEYTGDDCNATTNTHGGKAKYKGDPAGAEPVLVDPGKDIAVTPSDESLMVNGLVTVSSTKSRLGANTKLQIKQGKDKLQELEIHTSCSKPLAVGDQFGSLILREFTPE